MYLTDQRQLTGMGPPGAIPLDKIILYVDEFERITDAEEREDFIKLISYTDRTWRKLVWDKYEKEQKEIQNKAKPKARR